MASPSGATICYATATALKLKYTEFMRSKKQQYARPRHIAIYLIRQLAHMSYPAIERLFGRSDHTFALHAVRIVEKRLAAHDERTLKQIQQIKQELESRGYTTRLRDYIFV